MPGRERILMTADAVGGVWTFAVDLGRELVSRGVSTTLAVMGPAPSDAQCADVFAAGIDIAARPYRLEWMDEPWQDVDRAGEWLLDLERQVRPSLVHLNGYAHAALPWRVPVVVVAHSCVRSWWRAVRHETPPPAVDRYTAAVTTGLSRAQMVVAPTAAMGRALQAEYAVPLSPRTIPNGLPVRATVASGDPAREPLVLTSGRLWDEAKNVSALCDVAARLPWPVYAAGPQRAPNGRPLELRSVRPLGQLIPDAMRRWFRRASIYALPARYEPFGLTVLEAAAEECALVLGDIPTLRENWDGAAAFVDPDDGEALYRAIRRLIARPAERTALGRRARARAATFSIARTADRYQESYAQL